MGGMMGEGGPFTPHQLGLFPSGVESDPSPWPFGYSLPLLRPHAFFGHLPRFLFGGGQQLGAGAGATHACVFVCVCVCAGVLLART